MADDDRPVGPVIVRRRLGTELRRLREAANLRLDAVAAELEVSPSKISRIETGHSAAKLWDVRNLLELYEVGSTKRDEVLGWAADAKAQSWWQDDIVEDPTELDYFMSLEAEAASIRSYCTPVMHALWQTEDYARAQISSTLPELPPAAVDRLVRVRLRRQRTLLRTDRPSQLTAVLDEAALHRGVGTPEVMREQLEALLELPPTVELRIRRFDAGPHRAILSPFTIFTPRIADLDPVVVVVEAAMAESYIEHADEIHRFQDAFTELRDSALDPEASLALVRSLL